MPVKISTRVGQKYAHIFNALLKEEPYDVRATALTYLLVDFLALSHTEKVRTTLMLNLSNNALAIVDCMPNKKVARKKRRGN